VEQSGIIGKSQFDQCESLINDLRREGTLPLDFCASDEKRQPSNLEQLDAETPGDFAGSWIETALNAWESYEPVSFWDFQRYYLEAAVEKVDLRTLFEGICAEFHVPIWNAGGWSDINSRADLMSRFCKHDEAGRRCVLLYCGDHDPAGLLISDTLRENIRQLEHAVGWSPDEDRLIIDRFGLNADFIKSHRLTWIDGLETGGGRYNLEDPRHPMHFADYVQDYLKKFGARKVEANALVVAADAGRKLCRDAILKYIDADGIKRYEVRLGEEREKVRRELPAAMRRALKKS
jgi:hypothetical protein